MPVLRNDKISIYGLIVIFIVLLVAIMNVEIKSLMPLQQNEVYKQITGLLLFGFISYQWYFAFSRRSKYSSVKKKLFTHKSIGLLMPLFLFIHTVQYGFAYQTLIWGFFIAHCTVGFLNPDFLRIKRPALRSYWFILHISLSIMVSGLLFYHLYVVYYYT